MVSKAKSIEGLYQLVIGYAKRSLFIVSSALLSLKNGSPPPGQERAVRHWQGRYAEIATYQNAFVTDFEVTAAMVVAIVQAGRGRLKAHFELRPDTETLPISEFRAIRGKKPLRGVSPAKYSN